MPDVSAIEDAAIARFRSEIERSLLRLAADMRRRLDAAHVDERTGKLIADDFNLRLSRELGAHLARELRESFSPAVEVFERESGRVLRAVGSELGDLGIDDRLTTPARDSLRAQIGATIDDLQTVRVQGGDALRSVVVDMMRTNVTPERGLADLVSILDTTSARAVTLVDTTLMAVDRTVSIQQGAEAGIEWVLYDGPDDSLTRPFCASRVGKRIRISEINETQNDTGPNPVSAYAGGYNCRHRLVNLTDDDLKLYPIFRG